MIDIAKYEQALADNNELELANRMLVAQVNSLSEQVDKLKEQLAKAIAGELGE